MPLLLLYYCCRCLRCVLLPASLLRLLLLFCCCRCLRCLVLPASLLRLLLPLLLPLGAQNLAASTNKFCCLPPCYGCCCRRGTARGRGRKGWDG